ncbi:response regulator [Corallococcus sp. bb12-1]|uniref:PAS domain-containing hybrid sensor histidine kinase/response regulator n=1 Tax=Corallococcus sp. bb12-1 TaxID=2996784 RepID=UPI002271BDDC|nr:response regulator [Corallococcus sp. bb12-1]MCY1045998.1 response regulator [Corallococcus sp. bb12-1]
MPELPPSAYPALFEHMRDGALVLDPTLRVVAVNRAAEGLLGPRDVLVGMPVDRVLPGWTPPEIPEGGGPPVERDWQAGPAHTVRVLALPQPGDGGWVLMLRGPDGTQAAESILRQQKEFFEAVVDHSPVAIVTISRAFEVLTWNPAAERLFGYTHEEAMGRNILKLVANVDDIRPEAEETSREVLRMDRVHVVTKRVRKDGTVVDVELRALPVMVAGQSLGFIAIYHDVTDLQRARQAAEDANQAKSLFLATVSHEIRTPMNAIIGMAGLLMDTALTPEQRDFASTIRQSGDALLGLLNDMLDFSKIEAGRVELEEKPFNLRQCVESVMDLLAVRASEKSLDLGYHVSNETPVNVVGDSARLRQVLLNLVGNAVKFTERGGVSISVDAPRPPLAPGASFELHFAVQDTGLGIAESARGGLFQPFNQLNESVSRRFGGTGLGLAICKRLVEAMGGRLWMESEGVPGRGATFHFTFQAREAPRSGNALRPDPLKLQGRRVLVVDDNAINRKLLGRQLSAWGMDIVEVGSGAEALTRLESGARFDLAILDHRMPLMDGPTLAGLIRHQRDARELPLLLLTSFDQRDAQPPGMFTAVLPRPVKASQLHDALMTCLAQDLISAKLVPPVPALATRERSVFNARPGDQMSLRILLVEDNPTNQKLALLVLDRLGYPADTASNGREGLHALARTRYDVVLMDVQMPEMDGLETTRHLRTEVPVSEQPWVIAMTANAMTADRRECLDAGMDDFLSKPIRVEELIAALRRAWERLPREPGAATSTHARVTEVPRVGTPRIRGLEASALERLWQSLDGQVERMLPELIDTALESMPRLMDDARTALAQGEMENLARAAHTLKSNAAYFGAATLESLCWDIEQRADARVVEGLEPLVAHCADALEECRRLLEQLRGTVTSRATG